MARAARQRKFQPPLARALQRQSMFASHWPGRWPTLKLIAIMALAHCTLATRDLDRTREFFIAALGWRPIERPSNILGRAAWLAIAPGQELHLLEVPDFEPSAFEREYGRHIAIYYPRSGFADLRSRLIERGATLIEPKRETPFERFFFRDPNGYVFEVVDAAQDASRGADDS